MKRFMLPAAVFLVLVKNNEVLLLRRANTNWYDGYFDLVAGHIDGHESLTSALMREVKEEIGITVRAQDVTFAHLSHAYSPEDDKEYLRIFFEVKQWEGKPKIMEPEKCDAIEWFPLNALPKNMTPATAEGLKEYTAKTSYSESGFTS